MRHIYPFILRPYCKFEVAHRDGVHNIAGGNGRGVARYEYRRCARYAKGGSEYCWQHHRENYDYE